MLQQNNNTSSSPFTRKLRGYVWSTYLPGKKRLPGVNMGNYDGGVGIIL